MQPKPLNQLHPDRIRSEQTPYRKVHGIDGIDNKLLLFQIYPETEWPLKYSKALFGTHDLICKRKST